MATTIIIPTPLRNYAGGVATVSVEAANVSGALARLVEQYPELGRQLFDEAGAVRSYVNIYRNDDDVRYVEGGVEAPLIHRDTISIIPAIAGGGR